MRLVSCHHTDRMFQLLLLMIYDCDGVYLVAEWKMKISVRSRPHQWPAAVCPCDGVQAAVSASLSPQLIDLLPTCEASVHAMIVYFCLSD